MKSNQLNLNYYLRPKIKSDGTHLINLSIILNGKRIIRGVGISIKHKEWDSNKQKVKSSNPLSAEINYKLLSIQNQLNSYNLKNFKLSTKDLSSELNSILDSKENNDQLILIENYQEFLTHSKKKNVERTYKSKLYLLKLLKDYSSSKKIPLRYESIDTNFHNGFINYLEDLEISHNTVRGHFKRLKSFLNYGIKNSFHYNVSHNRIKYGEVESIQLFLDETQINKFFKFVPTDKELVEAQDIALFMYSTLQRYSDVRDFEFSMVKSYSRDGRKYYYWDLKTNKTENSIKVPLSKNTIDLTNKYKSLKVSKFPVPTNQVLNRRLKTIGELAGLDDAAINISSRMGDFELNKWEYPRLFHYIGCHTFRRSGITNSLMKGIDRDIVKQVSGHKDSKSFEKYVELKDSFISDEFLRE